MLKKKKNGKMEKTEKQKIREICLKNGWEKNTLSHITFTKKFYHILIIF